jgi:hypothetical protein
MDVRRFLSGGNAVVEEVWVDEVCKDGFITANDDIAWNAQKWVCRDSWVNGENKGKPVLTYEADQLARGYTEFWMMPEETLPIGKGDCEDGAILIAALMLAAGVPSWRVRVAAGWVQASPTAPQGGHGYCCYCRETDNQWVVLDWCYYEDSGVCVAEKPLLKTVAKYGAVWFSFNDEHAWSHQSMTMKGRVHK